jgi:hypothetical protein
MKTEILAEMYAPPVRRWVGLTMLYGLGGLLVLLAFLRPPAQPGWLIFLFAAGIASLWFGEKMRQATAHGLRLTREGLWETGGRRVAALDDIQEVDRGLFAFKPSSGFLIITESVQDNAWRPGLYWIIGRRIGIGGVVSRAQSKLMADAISVLLAERRTGGPKAGGRKR